MKTLLLWLVSLYRTVWYPIYAGMRDRGAAVPTCCFTPTCSEYARQALAKYPVLVAVKKIVRRLARCRPSAVGGYDPP